MNTLKPEQLTPEHQIAEKLVDIKRLSEALAIVSDKITTIEHVRDTQNSIHAIIFDKMKSPIIINEIPPVVYNDILNILELYFENRKKELIAQAAELIK